MPTEQEATCYKCEKEFTTTQEQSKQFDFCKRCDAGFNEWLEMLWGRQDNS